jgi:stage V sporulation protein G
MKKVTEVQILPVKPNNGIIAFASVVLDNSIFLGSIALYLKLDGQSYRITYPTKKRLNQSFDIYHPINKETSLAIEQAIIKKYQEIL